MRFASVHRPLGLTSYTNPAPPTYHSLRFGYDISKYQSVVFGEAITPIIICKSQILSRRKLPKLILSMRSNLRVNPTVLPSYLGEVNANGVPQINQRLLAGSSERRGERVKVVG
jgi:hypothetical protein